MMAEQKGRGGKKPKYQIADIGGSDLTPQDLSTERVLNFLIKGEAAHAEQDSSAADGSPEKPVTSVEQSIGGAEPSAAAPLPSPGPQGKKSLDHLFQRASAGGSTARDIKNNLRVQDEARQAASLTEAEATVHEQSPSPDVQADVEPALPAQPTRPSATDDSVVLAAPQATPNVESDVQPLAVDNQGVNAEDLTTPAVESEELTQLISLWKGFYRLNAGEIEAMSVLYRMSHAQDTSECHVKMRNLAEMSNLTYRYCQKVVRRLEQLGWITKLQDYDPITQVGVLYRINLQPSV